MGGWEGIGKLRTELRSPGPTLSRPGHWQLPAAAFTELRIPGGARGTGSKHPRSITSWGSASVFASAGLQILGELGGELGTSPARPGDS